MIDLARLKDNIAQDLIEMESMFQPGIKLTLVARRPGHSDQDIVVSGDDLAEVAALIQRRREAEAAAVDQPRCFICDQPLREGQLVLQDVTEGLGHRACFGEDRAGYVKDVETGEPLGPDDPIPSGVPYSQVPA